MKEIARPLSSRRGFTLIEVLVALCISIFILIAAMLVYKSFSKTNRAQSDIANMNQQLRIAVTMLSNDIYMAGYSPVNGNGKIITAESDTLSLSYEADNDGDTVTTITYGLWQDSSDNDTEPDLYRQVDGGTQYTIAGNIDAIEFLYYDSDGEIITSVSDTDDIASIGISILARTSHEDREFVNTFDYYPASCGTSPSSDSCVSSDTQWTESAPTWNFDGVADTSNAFDDHYHRRYLSTRIKLRNDQD